MKRFSLICAGCALLLARPAWAETFAPMALNSFSTTPEKIQTAQVFNQEGQALGKVYRVATDQTGKPVQLDILHQDGRVISISAVDASYEAASNVVVARTEAKPPAQRQG